MKKENFEKIAKTQFSFLDSVFGCELVESKKEDWGYELFYKNNKAGVKIVYEYQSAYIFITLYRLVNGEFHENPRLINQNTILNGYGLDDLIMIKNPKDLIKPAYTYGENSGYYDKTNGLTLFVSAFAQNLKKYGAQVLKGDFTIFSAANDLVKNRLKSIKS